jgi:putative zinc finger protein
MERLSQLCERARAWASLRADGELSELESALLDAHLGRCADCRAFATSAQSMALALRTAHLEPAAPVAIAPLTGSHRRTFVRTMQFAVAGVFVVAAGFLASASAPDRTSAPAAKPVVMVAGIDSPDALRELRRPGLVGHNQRELPRNRFVPGIAV